MVWVWISVALVSVVLSVFISSGIYFFGRVFRRADKTEADEQKAKNRLCRQGHPEIFDRITQGKEYMAALPAEPVEITSFDGLTLRGRYFKNPSPSGTVVVLSHGYKSYPDYDFGSVCHIYWERGCDLLVPWSRAHCKSDGKFITLGATEKRDLLDWCRWLDKRFPENRPIILAGMSMGSTVSLLAAADSDVSPNVCGVVADCGFVSIRREISDILRVVGFPTFPIVFSGGVVSKLRLGISLDSFSTVEEVKKLKVPVLFIHGSADTFVLPDNTEKNYAACVSRKQLVRVDGAQHCFAYHTDPELVGAKITEFLDSLVMSK